ncbi:MAG: 3-oxoacyl-ACP synthase, partial [Trichococcus sp.]|nr:3-oxoacyl-ACP synthase [Trichococcus sp.]
ILLDQLVQTKEIQLGTKDKVLMTGFGGGLTWGAIVVSLN